MKVVLIQDVYKLGQAGDVVKVADGYARNFLLPRKMAVMGTVANVAKVDNIKQTAEKDRQAKLNALRELAAKISQVELVFHKKADENGHLFGSVSEQDIAHELEAKGLAVTKSQVNMEKHIKELGASTAKIQLTAEIAGEVKITVENEE